MATPRPVPLPMRLGVQEATQLCSVAMAGAVHTQLHAHVPDTVKRRRDVSAEAQAFFDRLPEAWGVTLETAGPEHVLMFAQAHWLRSHTGGSGP